MAKDQVRVAGVLSACIVAGLTGVLWGQADVPPSQSEQESVDREAEAFFAEVVAEAAEGNQSEWTNEQLEQKVLETEERAREAEEDCRHEEASGT